MFDWFENFFLSTFAKNDPLITKTSGGVLIWGGIFFIGGKGLLGVPGLGSFWREVVGCCACCHH